MADKRYGDDDFPEYSPFGHAMKWAKDPEHWPIPESKLRDAILWIGEFTMDYINKQNALHNPSDQ